eukprot:6551-Chlamydomonas_euryale.AAC.3
MQDKDVLAKLGLAAANLVLQGSVYAWLLCLAALTNGACCWALAVHGSGCGHAFKFGRFGGRGWWWQWAPLQTNSSASASRMDQTGSVGVGVRVQGADPKGMPVLSAAWQRGSSSRQATVTKGMPLRPEPPHTNPTRPTGK